MVADGVDRGAVSSSRGPAGDVPLGLLGRGATGWRRRLADEAGAMRGRRGRSEVERGDVPVLRDGALAGEPPARIASVALVVVAAVTAVEWSVPSGGVVSAAATFWASWALCLAVLVRGHPQGIYRPAAAYLVLFGLFHGGLLLSVALRGDSASDARWLEDAHTPQAVSLAVLGMAGYTVAAGLAGRGGPPAVVNRGGAVAGSLGVAVQLAGIGVFSVALVRAGGIDLLSGGYNAFVEVNGTDTALAFGTLCSGTGAVLAVSAGGRARVAGWAGFVLYGVIALPLGTRGEVLFPLMAMMVIEARRHRVRPLWTVLGAVTVLSLADVIRQTRIGGLLSPSWWLSAPLDAIAEMGFSLRPVVVVLGWDEPLRGGVTFVAVPVRLLESFLGRHGGPPAYDDRLFNVEIANRVGQIGGSPVAEAFYNFGTLGVVLFMAVLGAVLVRLERRPDAVLGVVLLPLLIQVRNSFAPVPVQIGVGLLLVALSRVRLR